ncbi:MAG TPA: SGNH/GDSL hydrolase family protein [Gammaproteobacteria bacterium]|nr:SGNH/GDSL hydrolase family protein [Gammaproteobacteria bacterium]
MRYETYIRPLLLAAAGALLALTGCSSGSDDARPPTASTPPPAGEPPEPPLEPVSALYVLGDSLSDIGNAAAAVDFALGVEISPPTVGLCNATAVLVLNESCEDLLYRKSRVTDGPAAVELLAEELELGALLPSMHLIPSRPIEGTNYAIAGAKAGERRAEDVEAQLDWLLLDHAPLAADALVVVMIGSNDAIDALKAEAAAPGTPASNDILAAAVDSIGLTVERLLDFGARRLIVANVPDLATLPAVREEAGSSADEEAILAAASAISQTFDSLLDAELDTIEQAGAWDAPVPPEILRFDTSAVLEAARQSIVAQGGNGVDACLDSDAYRATGARVFHTSCAPAVAGGPPRFDRFVFWDGIHPTASVHAAVAGALVELLGGA